MHEADVVRQAVRERYAAAAQSRQRPQERGCCGDSGGDTVTKHLGYSEEEIGVVPQGADLGLGCGNPLAMLELAEGDTVVDLGSGGGIDCFLAAKRVGPAGRVIGVDMTPEMVELARANAARGGVDNVEFRLGEIEHLPVANEAVDVVISNCVVNLSQDKQQVFSEAYRVLRPGGRLSVSDIVLLHDVPALLRESVDAYVACLSGAAQKDEYLRMIAAAGFSRVEVIEERTFSPEDAVARELIEEFGRHAGFTHNELAQAAATFASIGVRAVK